MQWKSLTKSLSVGIKTVEIRSVFIPDELGNLKRHRVTTCWNIEKPVFSKTPAAGRLIRDESGKIGVMIGGKHGLNIKIGGFSSPTPHIFVAINSISKKARKQLLNDAPLELFSEGGLTFGREK
ncbi:MAG TPA: hypothetical protein PKX05_02840 [bacterium]|nr:hypothetical protein [bacterium]